MSDEIATALLGEMRAVKMLLMLQLLKSGVSQKQVGLMLGVSEATVSRMIPKGLGLGREKPTQKSKRTVRVEA